MLRTTSLTVLFAAGGAVLLCVLALRLLLSAVFALSGIPPRMTRGTQVLDW